MMASAYLRKSAVNLAIIPADYSRRFGFHNLRHSLATFLIDKKHDPKTVQRLLGHANPSTTLGLYAHGVDNTLRAAQDEMIAEMFTSQTHSVAAHESWVEQGWRKMVEQATSVKNMVGTTGLEPATSSVSRKRSNQLSYAPVKSGLILGKTDQTSRRGSIGITRQGQSDPSRKNHPISSLTGSIRRGKLQIQAGRVTSV